MNRLIQFENGLIGDKKSIEILSQKESAKILLFSDSHGKTPLLREAILQKGKNADCLIFLGDGSYDLTSILEESFSDEKIKEALPPVIAIVCGNGDSSHCIVSFDVQTGKKLNAGCTSLKIPGEIIFSVANKNIFITHGNRQGVYFGTSNLQAEAQIKNAQIAFFGHTHIPAELNYSVYLVNPGSVGSPRSFSPNSFALVEITQKYNYAIFYKIPKKLSDDFTPYIPDIYSI